MAHDLWWVSITQNPHQTPVKSSSTLINSSTKMALFSKSLQDLLEEKLIITKRTHFDRHPEPVEGCDRLPIKRNPKKDVKYDKTNPFR